MLSRRTFIVGGAAIAVASSAGWTVATASTSSHVRMILEKYLGPINIDELHLHAFAAAFAKQKQHFMLGRKLALAAQAAMTAGLDGPFRSIIGEKDLQELERFERLLLGDFHVMTDYPWRENAGDPIRFVNAPGCQNPFAVFS